MRILMLALTMTVLVCGCGDVEVTVTSDIADKVGGEGYDIRPDFHYEMLRWQNAERECLPYPVTRESGSAFYDDIAHASEEANDIILSRTMECTAGTSLPMLTNGLNMIMPSTFLTLSEKTSLIVCTTALSIASIL
jgi:hypothetical protein